MVVGAGTLGRKAVALLREIEAQPLAFVDSNPQRWGSEIAGLTVLSPADAAKQFGSNAVFFVTIWNDFHWFSDTLARLKAERYAGWDGEFGTKIRQGGFTLASLADEAISRDLRPKHVSGRQEQLENLVNRYIHG